MPRVPIPPNTAESPPQCSRCGQAAMFPDALRSGYSYSERLCDDCYQELYTDCPMCGDVVARSNITEHPETDEECCPDCAARTECDYCGGSCYRDDICETPDGESCCGSCYSENYASCCDCTCTVHTDHVIFSDSGDAYCESCYCDTYYQCDDCGCEVHFSDAYRTDSGTYCDSCSDSHKGPIHPYQYRPYPNWHGTDGLKRGVRYLGIEIETECEDGDLLDVKHVTGSEATWYAKEDGSLSEHGAEFVSHPGTIDYWRSHNWTPFSDLRDWGFRSYNASDSSCGMHVHVSRDSFSRFGLVKLALFTNNISDLMIRASRRRSADLCQWANVEKTDNKRAIRKAVHRNNSRYEGLNFQNDRTVEFRIFRGTLHTVSIVRNLDFVVAVCAYAENASYQDVTAYDADRRFFAWLRTDDAGRLIGYKAARSLTAWLDR